MAVNKSSEANITTLVVPSPTSSSYDFDISTRILAAGCTISNILRIVAPSLVIIWSLYVSIILSIPHGPNVDFIISATALHALIFDII